MILDIMPGCTWIAVVGNANRQSARIPQYQARNPSMAFRVTDPLLAW